MGASSIRCVSSAVDCGSRGLRCDAECPIYTKQVHRCLLDMVDTHSHTPRVANRRDRFREYMSRLEAAANPRLALERGFYVSRAGRGIAEQIAGRLELRPASKHLIVGGVGAGKSTQLLVAKDRLCALGDTSAIYIDVSEWQDLKKLQPGVLLTLAQD